MVDDERTAYHKVHQRNTCNRSFHQNQLKVRQKHPFNLKRRVLFPFAPFKRIIPVINHLAKAKDDLQICEAIIIPSRYAPRIQLT